MPLRLDITKEFEGAEWELRVSKVRYIVKAPSVLAAFKALVASEKLENLGDRFTARLVGSNGDEFSYRTQDALSL